MPYLLIRHRIKDFERWKRLFDEHAATREASGSKGGRLFRSPENCNEVVALFEWEDLDLAKRFALSENLRAVMQEAGVSELPDIFLLDDVESLSA
jgi:heme-degrading monooxygenase HmoA